MMLCTCIYCAASCAKTHNKRRIHEIRKIKSYDRVGVVVSGAQEQITVQRLLHSTFCVFVSPSLVLTMAQRLILVIIIFDIVAMMTLAHRHHECIHNKIVDKQVLSQQHVKYESGHNLHRNLLKDDDTFQPIRIRPYYDPTYINNDSLSVQQIDYIKSLTSAALLHLQSFVSVEPVDGPLFLDKCTLSRYKNNNEFMYPFCTKQNILIMNHENVVLQ